MPSESDGMENTTVVENKVTQSKVGDQNDDERTRYACAMVAKRTLMIMVIMMMKMNHWIISWNHRSQEATITDDGT